MNTTASLLDMDRYSYIFTQSALKFIFFITHNTHHTYQSIANYQLLKSLEYQMVFMSTPEVGRGRSQIEARQCLWRGKNTGGQER